MERIYLFDIDGTILRGGNDIHRTSFTVAAQRVYGVQASLDGIIAAGRTDTWLLQTALRRAGVDDDRIAEQSAAALTLMADYVEAHRSDLRDHVLTGVPEALMRLRARDEHLGLLTGNLSRIAAARMQQCGLGGYFTFGGFGEESADRKHLVPAALDDAARALGQAIVPERAVVIGDTPLDVEAARAHGAIAVAVATGRHSEAELRASGADVVLPSFARADEVADTLLAVVA